MANLQNLKGLDQAKSLQTLTLSDLNKLQNLKGLEQLRRIRKLRLRTVGNDGFRNAQLLLTMPLDTLFLINTNIKNVDFRKEKCKTKVIIYTEIGVDEAWIVDMAKYAPQTKFLNAKDFVGAVDEW